MRKSSSPRSSEPASISDGLALLDQLLGEDARLRRAIDEARLVLQVGAAVHELLERSGSDRQQLELSTGLPRGTLERLERDSLSARGLGRLRRIADALDLELRVVLATRPGPRRWI
jgi:hypothetical protein